VVEFYSSCDVPVNEKCLLLQEVTQKTVEDVQRLTAEAEQTAA